MKSLPLFLGLPPKVEENKRGLFQCTRIDEVFNAVLITAHNILMMSITPSPGEG
jgi:hypothetical protein